MVNLSEISFRSKAFRFFFAGICLIPFGRGADRIGGSQMPTDPSKEFMEIIHGPQLNPADVPSFEEAVAANPEDIPSRGKLLNYYGRNQFKSDEARRARPKHILWMIANHPEIGGAGPLLSLNPHTDGASYEEGKSLWLKQVEAHPKDTMIMDHAADYLLLSDRDIAEEQWKKAEVLEPSNPRWPERLAHLYSLNAMTPGGINVAAAQNALRSMEKAEANDADGEFNYLDSLAKMAFEAGEMDKARSYALKLLEQAPQHEREWNYGNAIHNGNAVLGRVALRAGNIGAAKEYLLLAGKTTGSPQLNSFGPGLSLARELLEKGESETVLEYLKLCRVFWKMGRERLDGWITALANGKPVDFGASARR